jgi:hypothetical protein
VVDQRRPCVGILETFSRFAGHCRSVSALCPVATLQTATRTAEEEFGVIDYAPRRGYNRSVIMTLYRLTCVSRSATFGTLKVRAGGTAIVRATSA